VVQLVDNTSIPDTLAGKTATRMGRDEGRGSQANYPKVP